MSPSSQAGLLLCAAAAAAAPPPPPGAVQELTEFATDKCVGSSALQGTWPYGTCSALVPAAVPGFIASSVGSVKATLGPAPHENVTFALFSDGACATALPATEATMTVTLNACVPGEKSLGNPTTFSRFQGHASAPSERAAAAAAAAVPSSERGAVRFGIITDLHYADWDTVGTRFYRDSIPKARDAVTALARLKPVSSPAGLGMHRRLTGAGCPSSSSASNPNRLH